MTLGAPARRRAGRVVALLGAASVALLWGGPVAREAPMAEAAREASPAGAEPWSEAALSLSRERAELLPMWARSYFPGRSGDIMLVPAEGTFIVREGVPFMHGSPWDYDARIPLILYGPGHVRPGAYPDPASHQDVGATLEALLGLPPRPAATGRALRDALEDSGPPRVVALLQLDGFRPDYLERYRAETSTLRRLRDRGAHFPAARVDHLPTATSVATASLTTAAGPAVHGITGNTIFDRVRKVAVQAFEGASPRNLVGLTLADRWSAETEGRGLVVAQGGIFYTAAALAGHGGCLLGGRPVIAAYLEARTGSWGTNPDCYLLPEYLRERSIAQLVEARPPDGDVGPDLVRRLPGLVGRFEFDAALELLRREPFGEDPVPDLFLANLKATDYVGHAFGPFSPQLREAVAEADRGVARVVEALEERAGAGGYALVVTADHGMPPEPGAGGRRLRGELVETLRTRFDPNGPGIVAHYHASDYQLYLDGERLRALGVSARDVAAFLEGLPYIHAAFTAEEVREATAAHARPAERPAGGP